jgi:hypothetical protein
VRERVIVPADDGTGKVVVVVDVEVDDVDVLEELSVETALGPPSEAPASSNETIPSSARDAPSARTRGIARFLRIPRSWHLHASAGSTAKLASHHASAEASPA